MHQTSSFTRASRSVAARLLTVLGAIGAPVFAVGVLSPGAALAQASTDTPDTLILRSGGVLTGRVLEETDTRVKFLVVTGSIKAERWFDRTDILKVERGTPAAEGGAPAETPVSMEKPKADIVKRDAPADAKKVYVVELKGKFGVDISQTPIREAVRDAKRNTPDYIIWVLENDFAQEGDFEQLPEDVHNSGELFRAEEMCPIFAQEIQDQWNTEGGQGEPPEQVFWIKQAMGGAAVLPLSCPTIYFAPEGRLGGLGDVSTRLGGTGDEVVRQKMYAAMMGHIESWGIKGGYDWKLMRAICRVEYVLSYAWEGGEAQYLERMPENPGETLLTDDGDDQAGRKDNIQDLARGRGDDVLTLDAELAKRLAFSKGTEDSLEDLIFSLGLARTSVVVPGRSRQIMTGWSQGVSDAKRDLRRLVREFGEIQVQGNYSERQRARGQQIGKLNDMKKIIKRYGEAIDGRFYQEFGVPNEQQIDYQIERIKMEQQADKR